MPSLTIGGCLRLWNWTCFWGKDGVPMLRSQHWGTLPPRTTMVCRWLREVPLVDEISPWRLVLPREHWWSQKLTESATTNSVPELHDSWWLATWHDSCKETRWSPRTRMLTRMLMAQMSQHMVMQSRTITFCNSLFEQSCACFPCYQSAGWSGKCRVWSKECGV